MPTGVVLADAGYGIDTAFRSGLTEMGLTYVVGVQSSTSLWPPGTGPLPPKPWSGRGRPPSLVRRHPRHKPASAKELAQALPESAWHTVTWREGANAPLSSRFAAVRVKPANRDYWRSAARPEEWFLVEWPQGENEPTKYWLSTLPVGIKLVDLVDRAKLRCVSSGITRSSSRRSASAITKAEVGEASTITPPSPSPPMDSWSPSGV